MARPRKRLDPIPPNTTLTLTQARAMAGLSLNDLATLSGVSYATIYDLETGRNLRPSHEFVVRIMRGLHKAGLKGLDSEQVFPVPDVVEVTL